MSLNIVVKTLNLDLALLFTVLNAFVCLFIYLFMPALGLHPCAQAFSICGESGLLFLVVCGLLIVVASLVAEHGL